MGLAEELRQISETRKERMLGEELDIVKQTIENLCRQEAKKGESTLNFNAKNQPPQLMEKLVEHLVEQGFDAQRDTEMDVLRIKWGGF